MNRNIAFGAIGGLVLLGTGIWIGSANRAEAPAQITTLPTPLPSPLDTTSNQPQPTTTAEQAQPDVVPQLPTKTGSTPSTVSTVSKPAPKPTVSQKPSTATPHYPSFALVTYKDGSFNPRKVTIVKGGTVRFLNLSTKDDLWIASDLHPVHNGYPERNKKSCSGYMFDQCKAVSNGGVWEFTFERQGTFGFHNEIDPSITGKVEVNSPDEKPSIPGY